MHHSLCCIPKRSNTTYLYYRILVYIIGYLVEIEFRFCDIWSNEINNVLRHLVELF